MNQINTDKLKELVDVREINIDMDNPVEDKMKSFIDQIINPYHFKYDDIEIMIEFSGNTLLEDKVLGLLVNI